MVEMKRRRAAPDAAVESAAPAPLGEAPETTSAAEVVLIEPFYGGSHKQLVDLLVCELLQPKGVAHHVCSLPARKWHWRLMASSVYFASVIPHSNALRVLFMTSMVNLPELLGLRPDLNRPGVQKIYYFHENQLAYPVQLQQDRKVAATDFQIGWAQIVSCMASDKIVFNSAFNRSSFLSKVDAFIRKIAEPEMRSATLDWKKQLDAKSGVLYFPLTVPPSLAQGSESPMQKKPVPSEQLTILWNHRWEFDKNPDEFFQTLFELEEGGVKFQLIVLGEKFPESPLIFDTAKARLEASANATVLHWGYAPSRERYVELLRESDVVISTSNHEFYGVAVLEAVLLGCYPLVPNRLVYPEFFAAANLFNTQRQLFKKLKYLCGNPYPARKFYSEHSAAFERFTWSALASEYEQLLLESI